MARTKASAGASASRKRPLDVASRLKKSAKEMGADVAAVATKKPRRVHSIKSGGVAPEERDRPRKPHRWRPGTVAVRNMMELQMNDRLCIPRAAFRRLVREVAQDFKNDLRFTKMSFDALQVAAEEYLVRMFSAAQVVLVGGGRVIRVGRNKGQFKCKTCVGVRAMKAVAGVAERIAPDAIVGGTPAVAAELGFLRPTSWKQFKSERRLRRALGDAAAEKLIEKHRLGVVADREKPLQKKSKTAKAQPATGAADVAVADEDDSPVGEAAAAVDAAEAGAAVAKKATQAPAVIAPALSKRGKQAVASKKKATTAAGAEADKDDATEADAAVAAMEADEPAAAAAAAEDDDDQPVGAANA